MIDRTKERVYPLSQLMHIIKRRDGIVRTWDCWYRWCDKNQPKGGLVVRRTGERIYLEFIYLAGVVHSSVEAFDRFWDKQNEGRE